jgi:dihydroflavonol-4-reductase
MKCLVTGATGFIGSNLVKALITKGFQVRVLIRHSSDSLNLKNLNIELHYGDLLDYKLLEKALKGCAFLFHAAAHYSLWDASKDLIYKINVDGTRNILKAAAKTGIKKVVYTSTVGCIGIPKNKTLGDENTPIDLSTLSNSYKHSKYLAEKEALNFFENGLPVVIVNPSTPIGPGDIKPTPSGKIIVDFLNRKIPAYIDTGLNLIDVRDCALGHILALEKGKPGERYILGNQNLSFHKILLLLEEITGLKAPKFKLPYSFAFIAAFVNEVISDYITKTPPKIPLGGVKMAKHFMYFDSTKAVKELGLPQTPIKEAFEAAVAWYRENGYVKC